MLYASQVTKDQDSALAFCVSCQLPMFQELTHAPTWQLEWQLISTTFGALLFPNFILLFYPVARGSVLLQATGLSWPEGIRYHRWVGHVTMYVLHRPMPVSMCIACAS